MDAKEPIIPMREDALIPLAQAEEDGAGIGPDVGALSSGISSFAPSPSLNVFTNIFNISRMDWMGKKLKKLTISPLPLVATTPSFAAIVEDVTPLSLVSGVVGNGSPASSHSSSQSGYFLRSSKKSI